MSRFSALQTIKQTNIHVQPHCTVISITYLLYSPKCILYYTFLLLLIQKSISCVMAFKPLEYTLTRSASSLIHGAAKCSSSSITCIFMSKDGFIHDTDVLAFQCVTPVFKNNPKTTFPRVQHHQRATALYAHSHPSNPEVWRFTPLIGYWV